MNIIITMAGEGSRFKKVGYKVPKHEIVTCNKSLFEWSMISLNDFFDEKFIFVVRCGMYNEDFIEKTCKKLGISNFSILCISQKTDGQASTALFADKEIQNGSSIIIYNIDTYVEEFCVKKSDIKNEYEGFIPVFKAEGDKWSFVKLDSKKSVIKVEEKKRISDLATIGFYYFKTWSKFKEIYNNYYEKIKQTSKEVYIAPMYQYLINDGKMVGIKEIESSKVHVLGTPEDLKEFEENFFKW